MKAEGCQLKLDSRSFIKCILHHYHLEWTKNENVLQDFVRQKRQKAMKISLNSNLLDQLKKNFLLISVNKVDNCSNS